MAEHARPPAVLALHMNHSVHTVLRVAHVALPKLDLAPYTTNGVLSLDPTAALSDAAAHCGARVTGEAGPGDARGGAGGEVHGADRCFIFFLECHGVLHLCVQCGAYILLLDTCSVCVHTDSGNRTPAKRGHVHFHITL